mgnify:CR=1 FL=1
MWFRPQPWKTASCAAMALTVATYALGGEARAAQILALAVLAGLTWVAKRNVVADDETHAKTAKGGQ